MRVEQLPGGTNVTPASIGDDCLVVVWNDVWSVGDVESEVVLGDILRAEVANTG